MIGCQISGELGNQFFRYAVARAFMERLYRLLEINSAAPI